MQRDDRRDDDRHDDDRHEVSTRPFSDWLRALRDLDIPLDGLTDGLPIDVAALEQPNGWMSWEVGAELVERIAARIDDPNPWGVLAEHSITRPMGWAALQLALGPAQLYKIMVGMVAARLWTTHRGEVELTGPNTLRVVLTLPEDRRGSVGFLEGAREVYRVAPTVLGLPHARVTATITPHRGEYRVELPPSMTPLARARRRLRLAFGTATALDELLEQHQELSDRHEALVEAHRQLQLRQQQLVSEAEQRRDAELMVADRDAQLQRSQKLEIVGQLAGGLAHDFNNVLMVIEGCAELLRNHVTDDPEAQDLLDSLASAVSPATRLIEELLTFSAGRHVSARRLDLGAFIVDRQRMLRRVTSGLDLDVELPSDTAPVELPPTHLDQVLLNLLVNARDAIDGSGSIVVRVARPSADEVTLEVADSGCGMDPDVVAKIFDPFFTTKGHRGTGLGLATVQNIVLSHGGRIGVESELGEGTTIRIGLPAAEGPLDARDEVGSAEQAVARPGETVLLVDDDLPLRQVLLVALQRAGYRVYTAGGHEEAIALAESLEEPLDALVSDVMLRQGRGSETAAAVRMRHPGVKVLLISGYVAVDDQVDVAAYPFLAKPFAPSLLLTRMRRLLDES